LPNWVETGEDGSFFEIGDVGSNLFSWGATGADRYEVYDPKGLLIYSGTATSFTSRDPAYMNSWTLAQRNTINRSIGGLFQQKGAFPYTLKAYSGSGVSEATIQVQFDQYTCVACGG
jgi:hypothetical protein